MEKTAEIKFTTTTQPINLKTKKTIYESLKWDKGAWTIIHWPEESPHVSHVSQIPHVPPLPN